MVEKQKQLFRPSLITADPTIRKRVLKLGDVRIPKNSHKFFILCHTHEPSKIYLTQEHFDYLMDGYDEETYKTFGHIGFNNEFSLYIDNKESKYIYINTEVVIK